jgi:hypothetical protein
VVSEAVYRERFSRILLKNRELMDAYGKHVDQFINRSLDIRNMSKADKVHFEHVADVYLMMQKEYLMMEKLFKLPFEVDGLCSDDTKAINIPAGLIKRYTDNKK